MELLKPKWFGGVSTMIKDFIIREREKERKRKEGERDKTTRPLETSYIMERCRGESHQDFP